MDLVGERVRLRDWREDDVEQAWVLVQKQPPMLAPPGVISSPASMQAWLNEQVKQQHDPHRSLFRFAIDLQDQLIGGCRLDIDDPSNKVASIGLTLLEERWGRGLGSEVVALLLAHAFEPLGLHRVEALIHPTNDRSLTLFRKAGFTHEGRLRERIWEDRWLDTEVFSLLEQEWRAH